ncbi:MAG: hypothetical protein GTO42_07705 [Candidatus Latescibacteria bacterium]|nr:hypothetical protein [Candidatus Latescibacterota bacterium]NIO02012.1 hypothetical protein [Candidatus Latescibacterota bacterium]NIO28824.1 hypothetical protein [Candidatus Latescibacterota bacterium]NIO56449.1 hypothetical protein [Candidatus Latescibacterota bacterium]NIT02043.1 hypothetical protein [Candidatus Latescibacterota bacterium]
MREGVCSSCDTNADVKRPLKLSLALVLQPRFARIVRNLEKFFKEKAHSAVYLSLPIVCVGFS